MEQRFSDAQTQEAGQEIPAAIRQVRLQDMPELTPPQVPPLQMQGEMEVQRAVSPLPISGEDLPKNDLRFAFWFFLSPFVALSLIYSLESEQYALTLGIAGVSLFLARYTRAANGLERDEAILKLAQFDLKLLGPFIEALEHPDLRLRMVAVRALRQMLPRLQPGDLDILTRSQCACLYRRLRDYPVFGDANLHLAMLHAMARAGTEEAVPYIEQLAESPAWTPRQRRVRSAARACLLSMEQRLQQEQTPQEPAESVAPAEMQEEAQTPEARRAAAQVQQLLSELEEERRKHQQPGMRIGFLIASWGVIVPYTAVQFASCLSESNLWGSLIWGGLLAFATELHRFTLSFKQTETMRRLAGYENVQGVGMLAEALEWPDAATQAAAAQALPKLLRRLRANDSHLLNPRQRGCLYRMLRMRYAAHHDDLLRAILTALEQVGDKEAIPHVKRLANSLAITSKQKALRDAAQDCLPALQNRANLQHSSQTLLRASSAMGGTPTELLLRPAHSAPETDIEQLLRPGTSE